MAQTRVKQCWEEVFNGRLDQPEAGLQGAREILDDYQKGDDNLRLNLYMQHRDLRPLFTALDQGHKILG